MNRPPLSPAVLELIPKARIVSFAAWQDAHTPEILQIFQTADDQRLYLTDAELQQIANGQQTATIATVMLLREQVVDAGVKG